MVVVTRKDLSNGNVVAQSGHAIAEFGIKFNDKFNDWHKDSNYLVVLSIDNEEELQNLYNELMTNDASVVAFHEPYFENQLTSICYYGTPELRKLTQKLDLALKN